MIEFIFYILSQIIPGIEPYDISRKTDNIYIEARKLALVFDGKVANYSEEDSVILIHSKDEPPNINYMNYYVEEIVFDEAVRVLTDIGFDVLEVEQINYAYAKKLYSDARKCCDDLYIKAIIDYVIKEDENYYPPILHNGLQLRNWFEMQSDMFCIEYNYNNHICNIVNSASNWGIYCSALGKYMAVNNIQDVSVLTTIDGLKLGSWLSEQRTAYRKGYISAERFKLLQCMSISMNTFEDAWIEKYELLKQYKKEYGHTNIEKRQVYKNVNLGRWCQAQRVNYKTGCRPITAKQVQLLSQLGFDWDPLETEWNRRYEQYKRYINENGGNVYIPRRKDFEGEHLGAWVETQRKAKNNGKLSLERLEKLKLLDQEYWK
ncbi:MAG: helicase associated domain-containing protein [Lachnospiraceae bacterium]|nr:helicase associated domain-containing protein [Lachnospiraceae bacterium]